MRDKLRMNHQWLVTILAGQSAVSQIGVKVLVVSPPACDLPWQLNQFVHEVHSTSVAVDLGTVVTLPQDIEHNMLWARCVAAMLLGTILRAVTWLTGQIRNWIIPYVFSRHIVTLSNKWQPSDKKRLAWQLEPRSDMVRGLVAQLISKLLIHWEFKKN